MPTVFVHIQCRLGTTYKVSDAIADREIHAEMYSVSGEYDLLVKFIIPPEDDVGFFISENLHSIPDIVRTHTTIAFSTIPPRSRGG